MNILQRKPNNKKAALLIGINYKGTDNALKGCVSDVTLMRALLERTGYDDITVLTDDTARKPTRANIIAGLERLSQLSHRGYEHIVIQYSGHGLSVEDKDGDEDDMRDEAWYTVDKKIIVDDEVRRIVDTFSPWATVFGLIDACHSGTSLDLPLRYLHDEATVQVEAKTAPVCNVLMISGCRDTQTSADVSQGGRANGAMTSSFFAARDSVQGNNIWAVLASMRAYMKDHKFDQQPQLSSSRVLGKDDTLDAWLPVG